MKSIKFNPSTKRFKSKARAKGGDWKAGDCVLRGYYHAGVELELLDQILEQFDPRHGVIAPWLNEQGYNLSPVGVDYFGVAGDKATGLMYPLRNIIDEPYKIAFSTEVSYWNDYLNRQGIRKALINFSNVYGECHTVYAEPGKWKLTVYDESDMILNGEYYVSSIIKVG